MNSYQEGLKKKMNEFAHSVYKITRIFPREELYGCTSQLRRAALSVVLNYIEGYARRKPLVRLNFLETSFGSLQEARYVLQFACEEQYSTQEVVRPIQLLGDEIAAMLWKEIENLSFSLNQ